MTRNLTNSSDEATEMQNIPGVFSPVLELSPKEGLGLLIKGMVDAGVDDGVPIFGVFYDENGNPMPKGTKMGLQFEGPGDDDRTTVTFPFENIRPYNSLTINEQQDPDHIDRVKHVFKGTDAAKQNGDVPALSLDHVESAYISMRSSQVIGWGQGSELLFERAAVEDT